MMAACSVKACGGNLGLRCFPGTGRKLRPGHRLSLGAREPEHEIRGEPRGVALDLLVQALGRDAIERGELGIEDDPLATQEEDRAGDALNTHGMLRLRHGVWRIRSNAGNSRLIGS
jgi:hypothetical protein